MTERRWRRVLGAALLALACSAHAQSTRPYLDAAEGLGEWLIDATRDGRRYPMAIARDGSLRGGSTLGLDTGAAGVGLFFLALHDHTRDPRHWAMALAAADYERAQHVNRQFNGPDYLSGAAGSGLFLLALHARSGDPRHLQWARDAAAWLDETALRPVPGQRYWMHSPNHPRTYTGIPHGAAGIALLDVAMHLHTGEAVYRERAEEAYAWVRTHLLPLGSDGAIGFKRLTADADVYNWWSGGSAGIMLLQQQLYAITADARYLDDLRRTADGLARLGMPTAPAGRGWTTGSDGAAYRPVVFSHGNASIAPALLLAHGYLGDPAHAAAANASIDWLAAVARSGSENAARGVFWEHSKASGFPNLQTTGGFIGTASVGWMLARIHGMTGDARTRELALQSADYLVDVAEQLPDGGRRWLNYLGPEDTRWEEQRYTLGWYDGNVGVGMFLLAAHELANGERPRWEVHVP